MEGLIMAAQLLLGLSFLVGIHEAGHMIAAKAFGMRVEKFSIGFPPKLFGFKKGETEYSLGMIPLGGFVKISGMIDESLDTKSMSAEPEPWEFRAKPAWQRLIVMLGGIIVNVVVGIIIYIALTYSMGESYISKEEGNRYGIAVNEAAYEIGLRNGDRILAINGNDYERFGDISNPEFLLATNAYYTVQRNGTQLDINIPSNFLDKVTTNDGMDAFISPRVPFQVDVVTEDSFAEKAGLQSGDKILAVNDISINFFDELGKALDQFKGQQVSLDIERAEQQLTLQAEVSEQGTLGFYHQPNLEITTKEFTLAESVSTGASRAFSAVYLNAIGIGKMISGDISPSKASGPIGIAKIFGPKWDWVRFWSATAFISMVLAFMNLLPIPALDGGHVVFLLYEMISGRKPSDKFLENSQKVGMLMLLVLMVLVIGNDIFKLFS
jgi:regulator of sigma E protease